MTKRFSWNFFVDPVVQVLTMLFVSGILYFMSALYLSEMHVFDPLPDLQKNELVNDKVKIKTGLFINNFLNFDLIKNNFEILGTIWFEFDAKQAELKDFEQVVFSKGKFIRHGNIHGNSEPIIQEKLWRIYAQYPVRVEFASNLNYKLFPFDSHRVNITINDLHLDSDKFEFISTNQDFMVSGRALTYGWINVGKYVQAGHTSNQLSTDLVNKYPRVIYAIDFVRSSFKDILLLLLPLLVVFFMSMFTFSYDYKIDRENILEIGVASVAAVVGYRFVIDSMAPKVPYFMLVDWLFILFLVLVFIVFLINGFNLFKNYRGFVILLLHSILIGSWYSFLFIWG